MKFFFKKKIRLESKASGDEALNLKVIKLNEKLHMLESKNNKTSKKELDFRKLLDDYTIFHNEIMLGKRPPRYMKCVLLNGWGNVLQEAVSCLLFAMASERAVIFYTAPIEGYMPFRKYLVGPPFDGYNLNVLNGHKELIIPRFNLTCLNYEDVADVPYVTVHRKNSLEFFFF